MNQQSTIDEKEVSVAIIDVRPDAGTVTGTTPPGEVAAPQRRPTSTAPAVPHRSLGMAGSWALRIGSLLTAVAVWHLVTTNEVDLWLRFSRIPPPGDVIDAFRVQIADGLLSHVMTSLQRIVTGFVLAGVIGVLTGMLVARSPRFADVARPVLEVVRPIPAIAWVPLAILLFPTSEQGIVFITFLAAFFPVLVSTLHAVRALPAVWEQAAMTMGATRRAVWFKILLPGILPSIFSGLSVAMGVAWICVISAEMISGQLGIGYYTWRSYGLLDYPGVIVGMLTIGFLGWQSAAIIELVGRRCTRWLPAGERNR